MTTEINITVHINPSLYDVDNLFIPKEEYIKNVGEIRWENEFDFDIPRIEKYLKCFNKAVFDITSAYPSAHFNLFVPCGILSKPIKSRWKETMYRKHPYRSSVKRYFGVEGENEKVSFQTLVLLFWKQMIIMRRGIKLRLPQPTQGYASS